MKFTTKTEYGLVCLTYMAHKGRDQLITIKDIVRDEGFSHAYLEKILQKLKAAGIVRSHQGKDGGYALARQPSAITLKEIIEALEGQTFEVYCEPKLREGIVCTHLGMCGMQPIWFKTKEMLDQFYASVTLEDISRCKEPQVHTHVA